MTALPLERVEVRPVLVPLRRPVVSRVGMYEEWPLILVDLDTGEGIVGRIRSARSRSGWRTAILLIRDGPGAGLEWDEAAAQRYRMG